MSHHRRHHHSQRIRVHTPFRLWLGMAAIIALTIGAGFFFFGSGGAIGHMSVQSVWRKALAFGRSSLREVTANQPTRLVYPYSIVAGGVHNPQQLREVMNTDPVAAAHYSSFDTAKAHVVRLPRDEYAYVSFRVGNNVYWTSHKLKLREGETLLTDGQHYIRTRCGNRVSQTPRLPTYRHEPAVATLDTPVATLPDIQTEAFAAVAPVNGPLPGAPGLTSQLFSPAGHPEASTTPTPFSPLNFFTAPPGCGQNTTEKCSGTPQTPQTPPPTPTPENNCLILFVTGAGLLGAGTMLRRRLVLAEQEK